jgi:hypothetical protein
MSLFTPDYAGGDTSDAKIFQDLFPFVIKDGMTVLQVRSTA